MSEKKHAHKPFRRHQVSEGVTVNVYVTKPPRLRHLIAELERRIEALEKAQKT